MDQIMYDAVLGIDPGKTGAICLLVPKLKKIAFMSNSAKPIDIIYFLGQAQKECIIHIAMIEKVHAIQGTSAGSNFSFGFNTGLITGLVQATGLSLDQVTPKTWQKYVGVTTKGKAIKKEVGSICDRLFPLSDIRGPRGGLLDGRSDALCIATYAANKYNL